MVKTFYETEPSFAAFTQYDWRSKRAEEYWRPDKKLGGGPLTKDIAHASVAAIKTPLAALITTTPVYGLYHILQLQD